MAEQICKIVFDNRRSWTGLEWIARNLAAHLDSGLIPISETIEDMIARDPDNKERFFSFVATTDVFDRFSNLLSGRATIVDLTTASPSEMQDLYKRAKRAKEFFKRPAEWAEPDSAETFMIAFDQFLKLLQSDIRVLSPA